MCYQLKTAQSIAVDVNFVLVTFGWFCLCFHCLGHFEQSQKSPWMKGRLGFDGKDDLNWDRPKYAIYVIKLVSWEPGSQTLLACQPQWVCMRKRSMFATLG